jgi:hypothetical protein
VGLTARERPSSTERPVSSARPRIWLTATDCVPKGGPRPLAALRLPLPPLLAPHADERRPAFEPCYPLVIVTRMVGHCRSSGLLLESDRMTTEDATRPWWNRYTPRANVRAQMFSAALLWLAGVSFLLVRGVLFVEGPEARFHFGFWVAPIVIVAFVIGVIKARFILIGYAEKAVARIQKRGHACYFGFFAPTSWLFVLVMMGGGIMLRQSALVNFVWGRVLLATLYLAVGTSLAIADRIFWIAALRSQPLPEARSAAE